LKQAFEKDKKELINSNKNIIKTLALYVRKILITTMIVQISYAGNAKAGILLTNAHTIKKNSKIYGWILEILNGMM